jgi:phytoene dehydrogenase-like protein
VKDVIIIGGGHNGLAAAFYLAKAGFKPLVLERRETVGGGAITSELHRGFRCPTLAHHTTIWADVASEMDLRRYGLEALSSPVDLYAPTINGGALVVFEEAARTAQALRALDPTDAAAYPAYRSALKHASTVIASMLAAPAPRLDNPDAADLWNLLKTGNRFRRLGKSHGYQLLRWIPMPVADLVREWFDGELLCASLAAPGLSGTMLGPRSAGSGLVLLLHEANRMLAHGVCRVRGGPGALTAAMAAAAVAAGASVQTAARVERILVAKDHAAGVVVNGKEMSAETVVSALDPRTTFLTLLDPSHLTPDFLSKITHYRAVGTLGKINLALSALPRFPNPAGAVHPDGRAAPDALAGRIHIGASIDYLERAFDAAKYGTLPAEPWLDITIPSILDPELAPPGAHVMSIYAHYAPYRLRARDWVDAEDDLLNLVLSTLDRFAPGIRHLVVAAEVITPWELEKNYGFSGGHIFHGELALDQLLITRPLLGYGRYGTPVRGLYMCSAGTHPGGFANGASGRFAAREIAASVR